MSTQPWIKFYPPQALDDLGVTGRRLPDLLADAITRFRHETALTSPAGRWTFERLGAQAQQLGELFRELGVSQGRRVAILLPNMPEYVAALFGTWLAGGTVVQVNPAYVATEIDRVLQHAGPSVLLTTHDQMDKLAQAGVATAAAICLVGEGSGIVVRAAQDCRKAERADWPDQSSELAVLQYTGGTTGAPKAVMLTHENLLSNIEQRLRVTLRSLGVPAGARIVNALPMCHVYGLTCVTLSGVAAGLEQLIVPRFNARTVLGLIRDAGPYAFYGVPTMYAAFLRESDLEHFGLDRVRVFNSAGAPMPPVQLAQFEARVGAKVLDGFGISEASPSTHTNPPLLPRRAGSSGIPLPFTEARTVAAGANGLVDVPPGETGELAIRGPQVMRGYWGDPELTAQTLRDGWLLTGDLARIDEDGYLYIVGRLKEIIVAGGYNIYPAEVERVIASVDGVAEVAVVGVPDEYRGETVKAVIVPVRGAAVDRDAVIARCRAELAPFKVPTVLEIRDELPRTAVGKIDKRRLALAGGATH